MVLYKELLIIHKVKDKIMALLEGSVFVLCKLMLEISHEMSSSLNNLSTHRIL